MSKEEEEAAGAEMVLGSLSRSQSRAGDSPLERRRQVQGVGHIENVNVNSHSHPNHELHNAAATHCSVAEEACAACGLQWQPGIFCVGHAQGRGRVDYRFVPLAIAADAEC